MRIVLSAIVITVFVSGLAAQAPAPQIVWSPKAAEPGGWTAPHRPHMKLVDLIARHKGQADWTETLVDDDTLRGLHLDGAERQDAAPYERGYT
jgi:hypothetical protein